jgi:hypothetical protein
MSVGRKSNMPLKTCPTCNGTFRLKRNQTYCSPKCKPSIACTWCGRLFCTIDEGQRCYPICSDQCLGEMRAERRKQLERSAQYERLVRSPAHKEVHAALKNGLLVKQPCEVCGAPAHAHHDDYSKPLDVRWLCRTHHMGLHAKIRRTQLQTT